MRRSKPDILVTHLLEANTLGPLAARFSGTPTVSTMHSIDAEMRNVRPLKLMLERLALRRLSDQVVAVSTAVARSHRERLGLELLVIPNAVPPAPSVASSERRETRQLWTKGADRLVLITIGRLSEAKAHDDLLHAMALLREVHQLEPVLVIAGAGAERENLEKLAVSLDLGEA